MDELDRLFGLLVAALARETRVAVPFPASEVYERLVPYRSNRARLNVATHQDYEMAVLRLLAGERNYVQLEPENVREATAQLVTPPVELGERRDPDPRLVPVWNRRVEDVERALGRVPVRLRALEPLVPVPGVVQRDVADDADAACMSGGAERAQRVNAQRGCEIANRVHSAVHCIFQR